MFAFLLFFSQSIIENQCGIYTNDGCDTCTIHYKDRNCGWCKSTNKCIEYKGNETDCDLTELYYNQNAKCGAEIPPPSPTPWPHYEANATFCYAMTGEWCQKCVSTNVSMSCGWCHSTKECIMGDAIGPFFGQCEKWSFTEDSKCTGKVSHGTIVGLRVGIGIFIAVVCALCIFGCYKVIKSPPSEDLDPTYEIIKNAQ
ncbi:Plexin repeat family protein [Tritrichomonas foetus]|uniref:Plexin repeat family protein n=1 Tax=Tritrichomonas foetus TaxID=1144522 RepID=A0A1J4KN74_9EUKA|nr:Plexin repeat family protein [Tritrichomonas foetus]|eukprot:OHT12767.1 Plexin repeat family protein [Tritrichomonas foetus]